MILERIPGERFSRVLPEWKGLAVILIAGGPSLTMEDVELAREAREADRVRAIAVNDAYLIAPWADVHYAADSKWHKWHTDGIDKPLLKLCAAEVRGRWLAFPGQKCSIQNSIGAIKDESVHFLKNRDYPHHGKGLSRDPEVLVTGRHSGFQALNIATLAGGDRIYLLGYDGQKAPDGKRHWHGDHPQSSADSIYEEMRRAFTAAENEIAEVATVINCSPGSAINSFPKKSLFEVLG
jgi:hypothetical protein